jgi:hypothetical protein
MNLPSGKVQGSKETAAVSYEVVRLRERIIPFCGSELARDSVLWRHPVASKLAPTKTVPSAQAGAPEPTCYAFAAGGFVSSVQASGFLRTEIAAMRAMTRLWMSEPEKYW